MTDQMNRDLGRLEGKVDRLEHEVDDLRRMTTEIHSAITEAKGGWKMLLAAAGLSSAITAALFKVAQFLRVAE